MVDLLGPFRGHGDLQIVLYLRTDPVSTPNSRVKPSQEPKLILKLTPSPQRNVPVLAASATGKHLTESTACDGDGVGTFEKGKQYTSFGSDRDVLRHLCIFRHLMSYLQLGDMHSQAIPSLPMSQIIPCHATHPMPHIPSHPIPSALFIMTSCDVMLARGYLRRAGLEFTHDDT